MKKEILTVGIDIGTTTSQFVVSRLLLQNSATATRLPRVEIVRRSLAFASEVQFTPFKKDGLIDGEKLASMLDDFYRHNGIGRESIDSGALIITGQTAAAQNARDITKALASHAGDFVVESAGPHLESILAAHGSGAVDSSRVSGRTILNIDIGGGTTNIALVRAGEISGTLGFDLGGRELLVEKIAAGYRLTVPENTAGEKLLEWFALKNGAVVQADDLFEIALYQAERLTRLLAGERPALTLAGLTLNAEENFFDLLKDTYIDQYRLSGGVAHLIRESAPSENLTPYGDLGLVLARALQRLLLSGNREIEISADAIRATVVGAGMHSLQISGSTIDAARDYLPIKNIRLLHIKTRGDLHEAIEQALFERDLSWSDFSTRNIGLVLRDIDAIDTDFEDLQEICKRIATVFSRVDCKWLIIITLSDLALGLSQILRQMLPNKRIITVDGIDASRGDYLDLGRVSGESEGTFARNIPVVVKTLLFYK